MKTGITLELKRKDKKKYKSSIISLREDGILIALDLSGSKFNYDDGSRFDASFVDEKTVKYFNTELKKKIKSTNLVLISYPQQIEQRERRRYYRIKLWEEAVVYYSDKDIQPTPAWIRPGEELSIKALPRDYKKGHIADIGAGGLLMIIEQPIKAGKTIGIVLDGISESPFKTRGRVVRVCGEGNCYEASVKFDHLTIGDTDKIMKFVFDKENALLASKDKIAPEKLQDFKFNIDIEEKEEKKRQEQARKTYRLSNIAIPIKYKVINDYLDIASHIYNEGYLRNISFTGASFITHEPIEDDSEIWIKMHIGGHDLRILSKSLRCRLLKEIGYWEIGIKFQAIDKKHSKRLVSFIYHEHTKTTRE